MRTEVLGAEQQRADSPAPIDGGRLKYEDYEVPPALASAMISWIKNADALAIIMALFAGVQVVLLQVLPPIDGASSTLWKVTRWFMYCGIFLHLGGAISAVAVIQMASTIPLKGRTNVISEKKNSLPYRVFVNKEEISISLLTEEGESDLLAEWGLGRQWRITGIHMSICFVLGFVNAFMSLILWVWSFEASRLAVGAALLPMLLLTGFTFYMALSG